MIINVVANDTVYKELQNKGFKQSLGYWLWNISVLGTPKDTGNAQSSVVLRRNNPKHIHIAWDLFTANYVYFLEYGYGPVTKYEGFISRDITRAVVEQLIAYIKGSKELFFSVSKPTPFVSLGTSEKPFSQERRFLMQANMNAQSITSRARQQISMIRGLEHGNARRLSGLRPETSIAPRTKGISHLQQIYYDRKKQLTQ